ncbi:sterol o-acyltransferase [Anaeramoeba flamelloides]|uniref:O-acyltransferase n=1 Tax=Anaeramoeba flamelloides TaxID=1746091 RepID=A0AAV7YWB0_9EUKA|nr:sterol o-acyltransferase [Anaeramoeba flamelloides]
MLTPKTNRHHKNNEQLPEQKKRKRTQIHFETPPIDLINKNNVFEILKGFKVSAVIAVIFFIVIQVSGMKCITHRPQIHKVVNIYERWWKLLYLIPLANIGTYISWALKRLYLKRTISRKFTKNALTLLIVILPFELFILRPRKFNVWAGLFLSLSCMTATFKSWSYVMTLFDDLDKANNEEEKQQVLKRHQSHGSLKEFSHFLIRPWLIYELEPPLKDKIEWKVIKKLIILALISNFTFSLIIGFGFQPIYSLESPWKNLFPNMVCLAPYTLLFWTNIFLFFFHCVLCLIGELSRYKPRGYYGAWWNQSTLTNFWRDWNRPVHFFAIKYIYLPCKRAGISSNVSGIIVFLISGLLHEYLLWGMFGSWNFWVLLILLGQPLTMIIEKKIPKSLINIAGEVLKFITFFGGLIFLEIFYLRKYLQRNPEYLD